jgi:hypothetical protein
LRSFDGGGVASAKRDFPGNNQQRLAETVLRFLQPCSRNAKIDKQLNFDPKWQGISAMTKCPRCNIEQEESPKCKYCGLVFEAFGDSTRTAKVVYPKRTALVAIILVVSGVLLAAYFLISPQDKTGVIFADVGPSNDLAQKTDESDLKTTAKELSGDVGILDDLTGAYTPGSIIVMIIFSVIGLGYFSYGKKSQQFLMLICGIALMGYSYFVNGTAYIILIGVGLSALPFVFGRK